MMDKEIKIKTLSQATARGLDSWINTEIIPIAKGMGIDEKYFEADIEPEDIYLRNRGLGAAPIKETISANSTEALVFTTLESQVKDIISMDKNASSIDRRSLRSNEASASSSPVEIVHTDEDKAKNLDLLMRYSTILTQRQSIIQGIEAAFS